MANQRTIATLVVLLVAMTAGAFLLMLMETAPIRPNAEPLAAYGSAGADASWLTPQNISLREAKWQKIVIHATGAEGDIAQWCHFRVGVDANSKPYVFATKLWDDQLAGRHVFTADDDFNADSIGVVLEGDFGRLGPSEALLSTLIRLTRQLRRACRITEANVYLYRDLDPHTDSPGQAFPEQRFFRNLK